MPATKTNGEQQEKEPGRLWTAFFLSHINIVRECPMHNCALAKDRSPFIGEECGLCFLLSQLLFYLRENWCWSQVIPSLTFSFSSSSNDNISRLSSGVNVPVSSSCCCCRYSLTKWCPTLCDPMDCSTPGLPVPHHLPEFAQVDVHRVGDAIEPSHPLSPSSLSPHLMHQQILLTGIKKQEKGRFKKEMTFH